ncbi:MAG TPA: hypothetical protein V6C81_21910 [Planktothrix sp.]|jgi:hypothetical protein
MEIKAVSLRTVMGASLVFSQAGLAQSAFAQVYHHPTVSPIICDFYGESGYYGAYSRFAAKGHDHIVSFGIADSGYSGVWVGARIDAVGFPAQTWKIKGNFESGLTGIDIITTGYGRDGLVGTSEFDEKSYNPSTGTFIASFNSENIFLDANKFQSIYVYASNDFESFADYIDITTGVTVDGIFAVPNPHAVSKYDCTGFEVSGN